MILLFLLYKNNNKIKMIINFLKRFYIIIDKEDYKYIKNFENFIIRSFFQFIQLN